MAVEPKLIRRIEGLVGMPGLTDALANRLGRSDLNSLLIEVLRRHAGKATPAEVLARYSSSRFTGASPLPYADLLAVTVETHAALRERFRFLELSPLAPMGTCASTADVDPAWSVAAVRGTEVVSDVTNVLALEAAVARRDTRDDMRLAAISRVVRPQNYGDHTALAHFSLLGLVSSGRDRGDFRFEAEAIDDHLTGYLALFERWFPPDWTPAISYTCPDPADPRLGALANLAAERGVPVAENPKRQAVEGYYAGFCLNVDIVRPDGQRHQLVDLGAVDWGARLIGDAKERMVVSGTGLDRLGALRPQGEQSDTAT